MERREGREGGRGMGGLERRKGREGGRGREEWRGGKGGREE